MNTPPLQKLIYENPLACQADLADWVAEGQPIMSFPKGRMRLENGMDPQRGQAANYLLWCPEVFPERIVVTWSFQPLREPGLAMFWMAAAGRDGQSLFSPDLAPRTGEYRQYHSGDINAYHLSYFRRKNPDERSFHTCNLRKSHGFHLVTMGADPIPSVEDASAPYHLTVVKDGANITLAINELVIFQWHDDGTSFGPVLGSGRIGFRQMAPLIAEYADLKVYTIEDQAL